MTKMKYENRGQWDNEPDTDKFQAHGLECHMMRNGNGAWCGYVIARTRISARLMDEFIIDLHGGLAFDSDRLPLEKSSRNTTVVGFDCNHSGDASPKYPDLGVYRTHKYAKAETMKLAEQVADAGMYVDDMKALIDRLTVVSKRTKAVTVSNRDAELLIDVIEKSGILPEQTDGEE